MDFHLFLMLCIIFAFPVSSAPAYTSRRHTQTHVSELVRSSCARWKGLRENGGSLASPTHPNPAVVARVEP